MMAADIFLAGFELCIFMHSFLFRQGTFILEAGEARPRSEQTGSLLPFKLRGKSPCLGTESVTGRPAGQSLKLAVKLCVELSESELATRNSIVMP
mmetsp:Transcript_17101/g.32256  ORF Transcript_17101/g.32256 Transcript_17101/m.32256 type:complete len:95 (-) Transcript_17101:214-498(-)